MIKKFKKLLVIHKINKKNYHYMINACNNITTKQEEANQPQMMWIAINFLESLTVEKDPLKKLEKPVSHNQKLRIIQLNKIMNQKVKISLSKKKKNFHCMINAYNNIMIKQKEVIQLQTTQIVINIQELQILKKDQPKNNPKIPNKENKELFLIDEIHSL